MQTLSAVTVTDDASNINSNTSTGSARSFKLYGMTSSSSTNRIRIALAIKGIPYELVEVNFMNKEEIQTKSFTENFNSLNQIPILEIVQNEQQDNGSSSSSSVIRLRQSVAILEYLEETESSRLPLLLPSDPIERARVREVVEIINSFIQPMQNKRCVDMGSEKIGTDAWSQTWIEQGFHAIESLLDIEGPYCMGSSVTLADCYLVPQVFGAKKYNVSQIAMKYPKIARSLQATIDIPEVQHTMTDMLSKYSSTL